MNKKINYQLFAIALLLFLIACADGRPEPTEAKKQFEQLYPGVQVMSIRMTEDEVMARSFEFLYRKPNVQTEKKIGIQFMKNQETQRWEPNPPPPKELP